MASKKVLAGLLLGLTLMSAAVASPQDERAIRKLYDAYEDSYHTKNVLPDVSMTTPDFTARMKDGTVLDRKKYAEVMRQQLLMAQNEAFSIDKLTITGKTAVAITRETIETKARGGHVFGAVSRGRDTWVKTAEGWKLKRTDSISEEYTLDGEPFDPSLLKRQIHPSGSPSAAPSEAPSASPKS